MTINFDPHSVGYCCRYANGQTCIGCGDDENGMDLTESALRKLLYRAIKELEYIKAAAEEFAPLKHFDLLISAERQSIVDEGIKLLGVKDLSEDEI